MECNDSVKTNVDETYVMEICRALVDGVKGFVWSDSQGINDNNSNLRQSLELNALTVLKHNVDETYVMENNRALVAEFIMDLWDMILQGIIL